jgi:hypothetical protein
MGENSSNLVTLTKSFELPPFSGKIQGCQSSWRDIPKLGNIYQKDEKIF